MGSIGIYMSVYVGPILENYHMVFGQLQEERSPQGTLHEPDVPL